MTTHTYKSLAKLNLFLRITGRKDNGYHTLQSIFTKIDLHDVIDFELRNDGVISREINIDSIPYELDLNIKAAKIMQSFCVKSGLNDINYGINIKIKKNIPMGAGLGGGSGNAATVLLALNSLWNINLPQHELAKIGLSLGADVPFFLHHSNSAWIEGIGEKISAIELPKYHFIIVKPDVHASTKDIFTSDLLIRNNPYINKNDFIDNLDINKLYDAENSLEPVVLHLHPQIKQWIDAQYNIHNIKFRMTGSGSCFFCMFDDNKEQRDSLLNKIDMPSNWHIYACGN
ncbi:MAG: hypothetical protein RLZZ210_135 [Pseudomonadota bacterium]